MHYIEKLKKYWLRLAICGLVVIAITGIAIVLSANYNLRATVLNGKFRQYTFTNNYGETYRFLYYKDSRPEKYNFSSGTATVLVSPVLTKGGVPIIMNVEGRTNNSNAAAQGALTSSNKCMLATNMTEAFSVYLPSIGVKAHVCTIDEAFYTSFFGNSHTVYFMQILPGGDQKEAAVSSGYAATIVASKPKLNDVRTIVASFRYLHYSK